MHTIIVQKGARTIEDKKEAEAYGMQTFGKDNFRIKVSKDPKAAQKELGPNKATVFRYRRRNGNTSATR